MAEKPKGPGIARKKDQAPSKRRHNIPRTLDQAKSQGMKHIDLSFETLVPKEKRYWAGISTAGASHGEICGYRTKPDGTIQACYLDAETGLCNLCLGD